MTQAISITVVEDDPAMNTALQRLLTSAGFTVKGYLSAEAFIDAHSATQCDCLIFDINLPGKSGLDLARRLRLAGIALPIIFITALENAE